MEEENVFYEIEECEYCSIDIDNCECEWCVACNMHESECECEKCDECEGNLEIIGIGGCTCN